MEIYKTDISKDKDWIEFLDKEYNMFFDNKFISYNDVFKKNINWHHLKFLEPERKKVIALLNGCEKNENGWKIYVSCSGVSFGGFLWGEKLKITDYIKIIKAFKNYLRENNFEKCIVRTPPFPYQNDANEEYEYALIHEGFDISKHSITNIIDLHDFEFEKLKNPKKRAIKKSETTIGINILEGHLNKELFEEYYNVLLKDRELKNVKPTHSLEQLIYLKNNLQDKIVLFSALIDNNIAGICILFLIKKDVILNFYLAAGEEYKKDSVSDFILFKSIEWAKMNNFRLYDIGTSNVGNNFIEGLFDFKKKFMADGFLRKSFSLEL